METKHPSGKPMTSEVSVYNPSATEMPWGIQELWYSTWTSPPSSARASNYLLTLITPSTGSENRRTCRCLSIGMLGEEWSRDFPIPLMGDLRARRNWLMRQTRWVLLSSLDRRLKRIIQKVKRKSHRLEWLSRSLGFLRLGVLRRNERKTLKRSSILKIHFWLKRSFKSCFRTWGRKWTLWRTVMTGGT